MSEEIIRLMFDIGHGGSDTGAVANGIKEKDINLVVGMAAVNYVNQNYVAEVRATRYNDRTLDPEQRVRYVTEFNPHLCVSIHHNGAASAGARGSEVIHAYYDKQDDSLAKAIMYELAKLGMPIRHDLAKLNEEGKDWYYMIRRIWDNDTKAIITEAGFVTSPEDAKLLRDSAFQIQEGIIIGECCARFLNLPKKQTEAIKVNDWGQPLIAAMLDAGIISKIHESKEPVEWDEFAKVIVNVCRLAGIMK